MSNKINCDFPQSPQPKKRIEGVCVCVNYSDFLAQTIGYNKQHFDHLIVVTTPEDTKTQNLCEFWNVECVVTDAFYKNNAVFNKGAGINEGLKKLKKDGWVIHFDCDIFLLPQTRKILELIPMNPLGIYSIDRLNCKSFEDWVEYLQVPERVHGGDGMMRMNAFEKGSRLVNLDRDGYVPIGYFQMWNPECSKVWTYPEKHGSADRSDCLFAYNFARRNRHLIPELIVIHLESEECAMGTNWNGRKSKQFTVEECENAQ